MPSPMEGADVALVVTTTLVMALCFITVALRVFVRVGDGHQGLDDLLMACGLLLFFIFCAFTIKSSAHGVLSSSTLSDSDAASARRSYFLVQLFYTLSTIPIRCSMVWAQLRIVNIGWHIKVLHGVIGTVLISSAVTFISLLASASRLSAPLKTERPHIPPGTRIGLVFLVHIFSVVSFFEDCLIVAMPFLILWDLHIPRKERLIIICLLTIGGAVFLAANVARLPFLPGTNTNRVQARKGQFFCSLLELGIGIVAGSAVAVRPLADKLWRRKHNASTSVELMAVG